MSKTPKNQNSRDPVQMEWEDDNGGHGRSQLMSKWEAAAAAKAKRNEDKGINTRVVRPSK